MFTVTNTSDETKRFNEFAQKGGFRLIRLAPGASGAFDIDPNQAVFVRGGLEVAPVETKKPKRAKPAQSEIEAITPEPNAAGLSGASPAE